MMDDGERLFILPQRAKTRRGGRRLGCKLYQRTDDRIVQVDQASPPVPRYRGCRPGCLCFKCALEKRDFWRQYKQCRRFRVPR